jgi:hypothetical protein
MEFLDPLSGSFNIGAYCIHWPKLLGRSCILLAWWTSPVCGVFSRPRICLKFLRSLLYFTCLNIAEIVSISWGNLSFKAYGTFTAPIPKPLAKNTQVWESGQHMSCSSRGLLGCDAVKCCRIPTVHSCMLPPTSTTLIFYHITTRRHIQEDLVLIFTSEKIWNLSYAMLFLT